LLREENTLRIAQNEKLQKEKIDSLNKSHSDDVKDLKEQHQKDLDSQNTLLEQCETEVKGLQEKE